MANTVHESRRQCLIMLVEKWKSESGHKPSQRAFADYSEINPGHLSQMVNGSREIGSAIARRIEKKLMLQEGYMDNYAQDENDPLADEANSLISQMSPDRRKAGIEYLRSLLKAQILEDELKT